MRTLVVIDIDGTIAHGGRRFEEAGAEPSRDDKAVYTAWVGRVQNPKSLLEDAPVPGMSALITCLGGYAGQSSAIDVIYLTSREEKWRDLTRQWLKFHNFITCELFMRPDGNWQEGAAFKADVIKMLEGAREYTSVIVIDDDEKGTVETVCALNGWTFLKARSGGQI